MNRPPKNRPAAASTPGFSASPPEDDLFPPSAAELAHAHRVLDACGLAELPPLPQSPSSRRLAPDHAFETTPASAWARSGAMSLTGSAEGPPLFAAGALATAARGAGHVLRSLSPGNALAGLDAAGLLGERAALAGLQRRGEVSCGGAARLLPTRDGYIAAHLPREVDWASLPAWLESEPSASSQQGGAAATAEAGPKESRWRALAQTILGHDTQRLVERARLLGLAVAPAPHSIPDLPLARMHNPTETTPKTDDRLLSTHPNRPLRLLDLSTLWAGPLASSLLGECGIEVLKIESPDRPDGARLGPPAFFDLMNAGKSGCALDLKAEHDRSHFELLLEHADLVIESARPRGLAQLGYDAASWVKAKPGRIWTSITGYGREDPGIAFGDDAAVAAGLAWPLNGDGARAKEPIFCGDAIADPLAGMHAAALVLGCLRKGRGGLLEIALRDIAASAARASDEDLVAPLEHTAEGWRLRDSDQCVEVAPPRARACSGKAPALAPLNEQALRHWTASC